MRQSIRVISRETALEDKEATALQRICARKARRAHFVSHLFPKLKHKFDGVFLTTNAACTGGICSPRYYVRDTTKGCVSCSVAHVWLGPVIFTFLLLVVGAAVYQYSEQLKRLYVKYEDVFTDAGHRLTLVFITMQIVSTINRME